MEFDTAEFYSKWSQPDLLDDDMRIFLGGSPTLQLWYFGA
jgi:hypothetical protein